MKNIKLGKIIKAKKLDPREVAVELFPNNKHPQAALARIVAGDGVLDADQISKFSLYSGIPIAELWSGSEWKSTIVGKTHVLICGDYRAELDTRNWTTKLFAKNSLFHTFILHDSSIPLDEYIERLNSEISKVK